VNNSGPKFKLSALALAMIGVTPSAHIWAQENSEIERQISSTEVKESEQDKKNENEDDDTIEVITVSGFKGSLIKSMSQKRNSKNVSDSIFSEDIGKSTDQNIADALSRVTGVSVQSEDGEGTRITVRGANPNQNMITLNGVQLTSADFNQAVDLSAFSSDILSSINVVKTPSADHDEGSLGASISLNTVRPLDIKNDRRALTLQGRYNDFSENEDYKISGVFSEKFLDDRLGFIIQGYTETNSVRRDEMRINDFQKRDIAAAYDQNGNIVTDYTAIAPNEVEYSLYQNNRDRFGVNGTLQFLPTDTTNLVFDFNYSEFSSEQYTNGIIVRNTFPERENFVEGEASAVQINGQDYIPTFSDPTLDWTNVNTDTRTVTRQLRRFADGGYRHTDRGEDTSNIQLGLTLEQELTYDLRMEAGANYSKTTERPDQSFTVYLLNGANPAQGRLYAGPESNPHTGIQPAGYDCTSGVCQMIFGDGLISENDPFNQFDNTSRTAWNPDDIASHNTNNFRLLDREVDDEQETFFVDFDWDVDFAGITQVEFGAKYRKRVKTVDDQAYDLNNTAQAVTVDIFDADGNLIGQQVLQEGQNLGNIPTANYTIEDSFPYDNFMESLGIPMSAATDGWPLVSAQLLQEQALGIDNLALDPDPGNYRETELKHQAAYLMFNYEYLGGRLTGDVGVRYIKTESTSLGNSSARFAGDNVFGRVFDPFMFRQLRDFVNNPECQIPGDPRIVDQFAGYNRIDGLGWDLTGDTPVRLPADPSGYPCYDPLALQGAAGSFFLSRHEDISRHPFYVWGDDPNNPEDRSLVAFATEGANEYDMFLPSLNVNYQVSDDLISRFAVSKTISRPNIDSLRPGFTLNENFWAPHDAASGSINLYNPELMPQESNNLDISLEWYFNETSLVSAAFFYKDLSNFEENEAALVYAEDLRHVDLTQPYDVGGLILTEAQVRENLQNPELIDGVGYAACFPDRGNVSDLQADWWFDESDDLIGWCSQFTANRLRNGAGAEIKGIELSYQQTYDFLPGLWSGLGAQVNYTYQNSKTDPEYSSFDDTKALPQYPQAWTPEHSYNATIFWEKGGHQIRLAMRGKSDELVQRTWNEGSLWRDGSMLFDLTASYQISKNMRVSFQAINLTDEETRNYFTSRTINLGDTQIIDGQEVAVLYDEGNPLEDSSVTQSRTQQIYKTGRTFRLDLRIDF